MRPLVKSEIEPLSLVIVEKPGLFHDQMHPNHIKEYLANTNPNPEYLLFDDLIDTNLAIKEHNQFTNIIKKITGDEGCLYFNDLINSLEPELLKDTPIPLPNLIFTRDLAITIGQKIVSTWASKNVRNYENQITKKLLNQHEVFKDTEIIHFSEIAPNISLEGGDVTIFNEDLVIIGLGERTSEESIKKLEPIIHENSDQS